MDARGKQYWVYVLWSGILKKRYVGSSEVPEKRLRQHNLGQSRFTRGGRPWILIYSEVFESKHEAGQRERFLKSGVGRRWLDEKFPRYRYPSKQVAQKELSEGCESG